MYAYTVMHKYCTGFLCIYDWPFMIFQLTKHHLQQSHGYRSAKAAETRLSSSVKQRAECGGLFSQQFER